MIKQLKKDRQYMEMAHVWAKSSHCNRNQVGALIIKDNRFISDGYNGTPSGFPNTCETADDETHWYVLHAEANAILKCARHGQSCEGSTLYITLSPCKECAKLIFQSGIKKVMYDEEYRDTTGIDFLRAAGVNVVKLNMSNENN